jgi:hypothetical protein
MGTGRNRKIYRTNSTIHILSKNATGGTGKKTLRNKARRNRFGRFPAVSEISGAKRL